MGSKLRDNRRPFWGYTQITKPSYPAPKGTQQNLFGDKLDNFQLAFRLGKLKIYGGPEDRLTSRCWDVVIHLKELGKFSIISTQRPSCPKFTKIITIPCHNNGAPLMLDSKWEDIMKHLPVQGNIAVSCYGGKGRTGTILAILKSKLLGETCDPVWSIRKSYCEDAVESDTQVEYVERITGRESTCQGSFSVGHYSNGDASWTNLKNLMDWRFYE